MVRTKVKTSKEKMSANEPTSSAGALKLTPENHDQWKGVIRDLLYPRGEEAISIMEGVLPTNSAVMPFLDQPRYDSDGTVVVGAFRFKDEKIDANGRTVKDSAGVTLYNQTPAHYAEFEKALREWKTETIRIKKAVSACAQVIVGSISQLSLSLMEALDVKVYTECLSNPVMMLAFIEKTHKVHNNAHLINVAKNLTTTKQSDFHGDFPAFIAAYSKCQREFMNAVNPKKTADGAESVEIVAKAFLLLNCDQHAFKYTIDTMNSETAQLSYKELVATMTTADKNNKVPKSVKAFVAKEQSQPEKKSAKKDKVIRTKRSCNQCQRSFWGKMLNSGKDQVTCNTCFYDSINEEENKEKKVPANREQTSAVTPKKYSNKERVHEEQGKSNSKQLVSQVIKRMSNAHEYSGEELEEEDA